MLSAGAAAEDGLPFSGTEAQAVSSAIRLIAKAAERMGLSKFIIFFVWGSFI
jgi:hypothetical protein